jgi:hypothetical protein
VEAKFTIGLHPKDRSILENIKSTLEVGNICQQDSNAVQFYVSSVKDFKVLIEHLDRYPLTTQKLADYLLWRQVVMMVLRKEHLTPEGLEKIVAFKATLNLGLNDQLK